MGVLPTWGISFWFLSGAPGLVVATGYATFRPRNTTYNWGRGGHFDPHMDPFGSMATVAAFLWMFLPKGHQFVEQARHSMINAQFLF